MNSYRLAAHRLGEAHLGHLPHHGFVHDRRRSRCSFSSSSDWLNGQRFFSRLKATLEPVEMEVGNENANLINMVPYNCFKTVIYRKCKLKLNIDDNSSMYLVPVVIYKYTKSMYEINKNLVA